MSHNHSTEVVIIGGGVIGLTIARSLAVRGVRDICLVEKDDLGTEASHAAAGMLAPQVEADLDDEFFKLACRSRDMYVDFAARLMEETGVNVELDTTGTIYLALTEQDVLDCEKRFSWQTNSGFDLTKLTASEVIAVEPLINPSVQLALFFPRDIQIENRRLMCALANSVTKLGVQILTHTGADEIRTQNNKVVGVETSHGFISCNTVVLAAGCWSGSVRITGRNRWRSPIIEPVRGQMVCLAAKPTLTRHVVYSHRGYIVPRQDGRLLAGSTSEPNTFIKQTTAGGVASILANAREISPRIAQLPIVDIWAGLRPKAADGLPVLGPCDEIAGLHYATGHYRNGILLAPVTGELIAQAILEPAESAALAPFSPNRFRHATAGTN
ncbi:MAG TPA: glycine oxidase ThiO [Pyrinomonadaceae bacterium]|nr:glycine oxidase ThiO [Pyrinomonadaceae bacterium]